MFRNYLITALRYIRRNKLQSIIQIASLTVGLAVFIQIFLYVDHELSHDKFNEKIDRIYRLEYGQNASVGSAMGHEIKTQFSEVENVVRIRAIQPRKIKYTSEQGSKDENISELEINSLFCDSTVFNVFTFPFLQGDPATALRDPNTAVITESTARALFGDIDPVGEAIEIEDEDEPFTITGVIRDIEQFHIDTEILLSLVSQDREVNHPLDGRVSYLNRFRHPTFFTYLLLPEQHDLSRYGRIFNDHFEGRFTHLVYHSETYGFSLRPLSDIYFGPELIRERGTIKHGNRDLTIALLLIAVFILVLASINYINLTTARSSLRAREVGVRGVSGSGKLSLISQFLMESVLTSLLSFMLAFTIVQILLPVFNQLASVEIEIARIFNPGLLILMTSGIILFGILVGLYPAIYLTASGTMSALSGELTSGLKSILFRRIMMVFQFTISVALIICVIVFLRQIQFMKTANLGFDKELIITVPFPRGLNTEKQKVLKETLTAYPDIINVACGFAPGTNFGTVEGELKYNGISVKSRWIAVDPDYFDLMGIKIIHGRNLEWDRPDDFLVWPPVDPNRTGKFIINKSAMDALNLESIEGVILEEEGETRAEIVGVVEDFHFQSLHNDIGPGHYIWWGNLHDVNIKISSGDLQGTIRKIEKEWESMFPGSTFNYSFLDDAFNRQYENDERISVIIGNFAFIAILIGCLGLFGLSFFMAERRTKEIGIRKSLGASDRTIFVLLSTEFIRWVALSVLIACPIAWFAMKIWLQQYAYRTNISWWIFIVASVIAFAISFVAVAWHAWKTARTNPVEALRYE